ncbi:MAG: hypothetical protein IH956_10010 [Chloroflexi bacterium]|nr:hypothetical protein [Chloroflexota bacterium]
MAKAFLLILSVAPNARGPSYLIAREEHCRRSSREQTSLHPVGKRLTLALFLVETVELWTRNYLLVATPPKHSGWIRIPHF